VIPLPWSDALLLHRKSSVALIIDLRCKSCQPRNGDRSRMTSSKRTRADRAGLSREQVLDAALDLVDRDGASALSMRRLGAELGVEAMTLYHYLPSKDALLDGIVERVMGQAETRLADGPWDRALTAYAR